MPAGVPCIRSVLRATRPARRRARPTLFEVDFRRWKGDIQPDDRVPSGAWPDEMKTATKNGKSRLNGTRYTRQELLAAHERALKRLDRMTAQEGFETLVKAGIFTPDGKLSPRYGG